MSTSTGDLTAILESIRTDLLGSAAGDHFPAALARHAAALLAAVDEALKLAGEWETAEAEADALGDDLRSYGCAEAYEDCAAGLREAIAGALTEPQEKQR